MLILSRKTQEAVVVGNSGGIQPSLTVTVLEIKGGSVRLGFLAANTVPIHRLEVWEKIRRGILPGSPKRGPPAPVTT